MYTLHSVFNNKIANMNPSADISDAKNRSTYTTYNLYALLPQIQTHWLILKSFYL